MPISLAVAALVVAPSFTAAGVVPAMESRTAPLTPGILVSIYGTRLGPKKACTARNDYAGYPAELCGVRVTIAGVTARLLYVHSLQINLQTPVTTPTEGRLAVVVTHQGVSSAAVPVRFAPRRARLRLDGPASVHMPVWIRLELPKPWNWGDPIRYPITIRPGDFGAHEFEVRRDGVPLPRAAWPFRIGTEGPHGVGGLGGNLLGLPAEPKRRGRLPLHLVYRFDTPGDYEVRYQGFDWRYPRELHVLARSAWTKIQIQPYSEEQRETWLRQQERSAPQDVVELLSDYLPSLLALRDARVLRVLERYRSNPNSLVREYVARAEVFSR